MSLLIDDLLRLAKVNRQGLSLREVRLDTLIQEVLDELPAEVQLRNIEWRIATLPSVRCDHGLMRQVLANLISNAIKYTRPREQAIIEVGQTTISAQSVFYVRDNGVGFDMKHAEVLFAPFHRLHRQTEFEGTGIGLATVHRIIEKHKGEIWAESEPGRGSTFYFAVPGEEGYRTLLRDKINLAMKNPF